jgi:hypothetical protein
MHTGASLSAQGRVRTSVVVQSREADWGVRGPGRNVRPDVENVPCCARAHMRAASPKSHPAHIDARHMCVEWSKGWRGPGEKRTTSGMRARAGVAGPGPTTVRSWSRIMLRRGRGHTGRGV